MKLLVVCQHYYPETFSLNILCEQLALRGHQITVLTAIPSYGSENRYPGFEKKFEEDHNGVHIIRVDASPRTGGAVSLLKNYYSFYRNAKSADRKLGNFDVVFSMCLSPLTSILPAADYAKKHQVKHVHYCADIWPEVVCATGYVKPDSPLYYRLLRFSQKTYAAMDWITVSSPSFISYLEKIDGVDPSKINYIPQPFIEEKPGETKHVFNHRFNFVYAGNVGTLQMVDTLLAAFSCLSKELDVGFTLIGSGSCLDEVLKQAKAMDPNGRFEYLGHLSSKETNAICAKATGVFVTLKPTDSAVSKTLPNKVIASLSLGKPIIASIIGDGRDTLEKAGGTIFCDPNPEAIAQGVVKMIKLTPAELQSMGEANRAYFKANFDYVKIIDAFEKTLLAQCPKKAACPS
jgi:glycosyltransferase involved in cell wall biosynthesis